MSLCKDLDVYLQPPTNTRLPTLSSEELDYSLELRRL